MLIVKTPTPTSDIHSANYLHRFIDKNWINHSLSQDSSDSPSWYAIALETSRDVTDDVCARVQNMLYSICVIT